MTSRKQAEKEMTESPASQKTNRKGDSRSQRSAQQEGTAA
jgi:hypothetical protein